MAGQAVVGRALLLMTIDAKTHSVVHDTLSDRHLRQIAVAGRAFHLRADMRRMIETDVRFLVKAIDPLPGHIFVPLGMVTERLDTRIRLISDIFMTGHADIDAGNPGASAFFHALMAVRASDADIGRMNFVRKIDRLLWPGPDVQEMPGGIAETGVRRREGR